MLTDSLFTLKPHEIYIFDNVLPPHQVSFLEEVCMSYPRWNMGLTYSGTSSFSNKTAEKFDIKNIYEQFQLGYSIVDRIRNQFDLDLISQVLAPISNLSLEKRYMWFFENLLRIKINLQTKAPKIAQNRYNFPHIDVNGPDIEDITTFLYYVNDSDGDTYFFKEKIDEVKGHPKKLDNLTVIKKISPKKGRLVMFKGDILHAGSHPVDSNERVVINYNIILNKMKENASKEFENQLFKNNFPNHTPA